MPSSSSHNSAHGNNSCLTNDFFSMCKASAVQNGYWFDPVIMNFVNLPSFKSPVLFNRYLFMRVRIIEMLALEFTKVAGKDSQILVLGAGFDTLFWRLKNVGAAIKKYVECDFPIVTKKKISLIKNSAKDSGIWEYFSADDIKVNSDGTDLTSNNFDIISANLQDTNNFEAKLAATENFSWSNPTLIIAEFVFYYIPWNDISSLCKFLSSRFTQALLVCHEMVNLNDEIGPIIMTILDEIMGVKATDEKSEKSAMTLDSFQTKISDAGWIVKGTLLTDVFYHCIDEQERARVNNIENVRETKAATIEYLDFNRNIKERFDCINQFKDLMDYMCIVVAGNNEKAKLINCEVFKIIQGS